MGSKCACADPVCHANRVTHTAFSMDCSQVKPSAIIKSLLSFAFFIGVCAGVVYLLVTSSNAKHARGGDGFGMKWSGADRIHDHNLNSNFFTDIQNEGGWKHALLGVGLFIVASCVCCPFCCRYIFPLIFHLARGGKWGESVEEFEERKRKEEGGEEADKMETGKLGEEEQKTKQGEIEQNN